MARPRPPVKMGAGITERPFSDLLRRPKEVTTDVEEGDVVLRIPKALQDALGDGFPWLEFLPALDRWSS